MIYDLTSPELLTDEETQILYSKKESKDLKIKLTRFCLSGCIILIAVTLIITDRIMAADASDDSDPPCKRYNYLRKLGPIIGCTFLALFILFGLSIHSLISTLKLKFMKVNGIGMKNVFEKEFKTLSLILIAFSISYLAQFFCDTLPLVIFPSDFIFNSAPCPMQPAEDISDLIILNLCDGYVYDFMPIAIVLLYHRRNFRVVHTDSRSLESDVTANLQTPGSLGSNEEEKALTSPCYAPGSVSSNEEYIRQTIKNMHSLSYKSRQSTRENETDKSISASKVGSFTIPETQQTNIGTICRKTDIIDFNDSVLDPNMPTPVQ